MLDCLEFDDALRFGDVLADVAFLAMDLERLGAPTLAHRFLDCYRELSNETHPTSLEHHYVALRAHIRAKVACLRGNPSSVDEAKNLHCIALAHLRRAKVTIVLVGGAPGTGKSTLAEGIAAWTGWAVLRSDEVRKDLAGMGHLDRSATAEVGTGIYEEFATHATYAGLLARARVLVERGQSVVLDATWGDARHRSAAAALATETRSDLVELRCDAPLDACAARIERRAAHGRDAVRRHHRGRPNAHSRGGPVARCRRDRHLDQAGRGRVGRRHGAPSAMIRGRRLADLQEGPMNDPRSEPLDLEPLSITGRELHPSENAWAFHVGAYL